MFKEVGWLCFFAIVIGVSAQPSYDGTTVCSGGLCEAYLIPPYASSHASFIESIPNSNCSQCYNLIVAYFSGSGEGENGTGIVTTILKAGSSQWPEAKLRSQRFGYSNQNPVIHYNSSGELYLFHTQQPSATGTVENTSTIWTLFSNNDGQSFSAPQVLFPGAGSYDRNRIILDLNSNWLYPLYNESVGGSVLARKTVGETVLPDTNWVFIDYPSSVGLVQPTIVRPTPGNPFLRAYFRDRHSQHIYTATSNDDGKSWTKPDTTPLPNNNAAIQATLLQSGKIAIVYNPLNSGRYIIAISLSDDQGVTWNTTKLLENSSNKTDEFSYPSILQTPDQIIHVTYTYLRQTIKYVSFSESWIYQQE